MYVLRTQIRSTREGKKQRVLFLFSVFVVLLMSYHYLIMLIKDLGGFGGKVQSRFDSKDKTL